jgi:hypothetical protein
MTTLFSRRLNIARNYFGALRHKSALGILCPAYISSKLVFLFHVARKTAYLVLAAAVASLFILPAPAIGDGTYYDGLGNSMPYRLFTPSGYTPDQKLPLIVFLHANGDGGTLNHLGNLISAIQGGYGAQYKSLLLVPQVQVPPLSLRWNQYQAENMAMGLIGQICSTYKADTNRIYLTGISMGGIGTWAYAADHPEKFAAAAPLSGTGASSNAISILKDVPIWMYHGAADTVLSVTNDDLTYDALKNAGGNVYYTRPDGVGHAGWENLFSTSIKNSDGQNFYQWMFSQSLSVPEPSLAVMIAGAIAFGGVCWLKPRVLRGNKGGEQREGTKGTFYFIVNRRSFIVKLYQQSLLYFRKVECSFVPALTQRRLWVSPLFPQATFTWPCSGFLGKTCPRQAWAWHPTRYSENETALVSPWHGKRVFARADLEQRFIAFSTNEGDPIRLCDRPTVLGHNRRIGNRQVNRRRRIGRDGYCHGQLALLRSPLGGNRPVDRIVAGLHPR